jgi:hypothetical protein
MALRSVPLLAVAGVRRPLWLYKKQRAVVTCRAIFAEPPPRRTELRPELEHVCTAYSLIVYAPKKAHGLCL